MDQIVVTKPQLNEVWDTKEAITFPNIRRAVLSLPYGSSFSVMFQILARTGMRISELDSCFISNIKRVGEKYALWWYKGKNQTGMRREEISERWIRELIHYRENNPVPSKRMFGPTHETFKRRFDRFMRERIGGEWLNKKATLGKKTQYAEDWEVQLKGLRKTFVTFDFARNLQRYPEHMALCMTMRRMGHQSDKTTGVSYVVNFDKLEIDRWLRYQSLNEIVDKAFEQKPLLEFIEEDPPIRKG